MSTIAYVRDLLLSCPHIQASSLDMCVDMPGDNPVTYSIEPMPTQPIVKRYLDGSMDMRLTFALSAVFDTLSDGQRIENATHFEQLALWMAEATRKRQLPPMETGKTPKRLTPVGAGYLMDMDPDATQSLYQMQAELTYYVKAR